MTAQRGDAELYRRGVATLVASWGAYASDARGSALVRRPGVALGVFPTPPDVDVYNNALVERDMSPPRRTAAVDAMEDAYARAGIRRFAAWVHESDGAMRTDLDRRGYVVADATWAMGMDLDELSPGAAHVSVDVVPVPWTTFLRVFDMSAGLLDGVDLRGFRIAGAVRAGEVVSTAASFVHEGDCGIFNVGTVPAVRRQGLASAVTAHLLRDAREAGCTTASLQATDLAHRAYARLGFRDLGRFLEHTPGGVGVA